MLVQSQGVANLTTNNFFNNATGLDLPDLLNPVTVTAHFNRIISNTTAINNPGNATVDLEKNWWGCNAGPGNPGCGAVNGTNADFTPWIVLGVSALPTSVIPGGQSTITADMTDTSAGADTVTTVPLPDAQFTATNGTILPSSDPFSAGLADSTFTSTNGMNASACAQVDNEQECAAITVTAPTFTIDDVTMSEGDGGTTDFTFTVTKTGATGLPATVDYETVNGTAAAPTDFTAITATTLTFPASGPGSDSQTVTVSVNGDTTYETAEAFTVHLSNATNATISDADGTGTINNDDAAPTLTINNVTTTEGSPPGIPPGPTKNFTFTVTRTGTTEVGSTVNFATANGAIDPAVGGTCGAGVDYNSNSGVVTFPATGAGSTSQTITIQVCRDTVYELNETFFVNLSGAVDATISDSQGQGTALNDDNPPELTVNDVSQFEGHSGDHQLRIQCDQDRCYGSSGER